MEFWLPLIFVGVMGLALLIYIVLDGYDLGIGLLLPLASETEKDQMIASIGPFWDANETWIVLGIGVLLIAFPQAYGIVLTSLYLPVTLMLMGLILRGVAFDFRVKAGDQHKTLWNRLFFTGSLLAALSQGWMLGYYVMGLQHQWVSYLFAATIALALPALYLVLGCSWLIIKSQGELFDKAIRWGRYSLPLLALGLVLISIATPIASEVIANKWFSLPAAIVLSPIPLTTLMAFGVASWALLHPQILAGRYHWLVFACMAVICVMCTLGLAYSIFPDIIIDRLTIWETATDNKSLLFVLVGVVITVPMIIGYTFYIYRIFAGKMDDLSYN